MSRRNLLALSLIAPVFLLIAFSFLAPLATTLYRAVDDRELTVTLPRSAAILKDWSGEGLPPDEIFPTITAELREARQNQTIGELVGRLNFEEPGLRSMLLQASRTAVLNPSAATLAYLDPRWGQTAFWRMMKRATGPWTGLYFLRSLDLKPGPDGGIARVAADEAVFIGLFRRTFEIAFCVTLLSLVFAYPAAYGLSVLPRRWATIGLMLVLVPFWTSILVRTTAWFILLQREGPLNALLLSAGIIDQPLTMIFTRFAVYVAMVHVLLPFAILPLYSVMKGIRPEYLRAAASLGAPPWQQFLRVYLPLTMPGVAAGGLMVFMLAVGFYITPALVGGPGDQMVSAFIAFFTNVSVNWGMAAALASLLMAITGALVIAARIFVPGFRPGSIRI